MGRDSHPSEAKFKRNLPFILTAIVFLAVTVPGLLLRPYIYSYDSNTGSNNHNNTGGSSSTNNNKNNITTSSSTPYKDTGFTISFDWSKDALMINELYVSVYTFLLVLFIIFFGQNWSRQKTILRRFMLCFTLGEILQYSQMLTTIFPEPNPHIRTRLESHRPPGGWCFMMYPILYCVGLLTVQFYTTFKPVVGVAYVVSIAGLWLLVPTHFMYSVDILCALIAGIYPFLIYHWYVRTTMSMMKRRALVWYEQDALIECNTRGSITYSLLQGQRGQAGNYKSTTTPSASSPDGEFGGSAELGAGVRGGFGGPGEIVSLESPAVEYNLNEFRAPTFVGKDEDSFEAQLVEEVDLMLNPSAHGSSSEGETQTALDYEDEGRSDDRQQKRKQTKQQGTRRNDFKDGSTVPLSCNSTTLRYIGTSWVFTALIGAASAIGTYWAVWYADKERPIKHPLPSDVLYPYVPKVNPHAADIFLYIQVGCVFLGSLYSSQRLHIIRRTGFLFSLAMLMRCVTVIATFPPDPSPLCAQTTHAPGVTCGDLIYSGHSITFLMSAYIVRKYCPIWWLEVLTWLWTTAGLFMVVASKLHYTRDVLTALIVGISFIHLTYVSIFDRPDRRIRYRLLFWLEFDHSWWMWRKEMKELRGELLSSSEDDQGAAGGVSALGKTNSSIKRTRGPRVAPGWANLGASSKETPRGAETDPNHIPETPQSLDTIKRGESSSPRYASFDRVES